MYNVICYSEFEKTLKYIIDESKKDKMNDS